MRRGETSRCLGWGGLALMMCVVSLFGLGQAASESVDFPIGVVRMALFYSAGSEESMGIIEGVLPALEEVYPLQVRLYDVNISKNYALLLALEEQFGQKENELPVVFIGEDVIAGEEQIAEKLEPTIARYEALGGCDFPEVAGEGRGALRTLNHPVYLLYFYQRGCARCDRVGSLVSHLKDKFAGLVVREVDIESTEGKVLNESLCDRMGVPEGERLIAPSVFFPQDALVGNKITTGAVEAAIEKYNRLEPLDPPWLVAEEGKEQARLRIVERFKGLGVLTVLAAGFIDGLNPCAFATLIFFVSYLAFVGRNRREIFLVGLAFSFSVGVTYFLVGLGLLRVFQSLTVLPLLSRYVYLGAIGLALVFGVLSLYDYALSRRGRVKDMVLQMPAFLKDRVRGVIRREVTVNRYILAAVITGFFVSILELACTGQVYLPTILFVSKTQEYRMVALGYLALYNMTFLIPLLAVFALVYWGTSSERLAILFQRRVSWVKLATSLLFFLLAVAMAARLF